MNLFDADGRFVRRVHDTGRRDVGAPHGTLSGGPSVFHGQRVRVDHVLSDGDVVKLRT